MGDTYIGECRICHIETDLINGICGECALKEERNSNMSENQLQIIVKESGLEATKAKTILEKFQGYFEVAAEWERKAKFLVVNNETQKAEMEMARTGRLFLREKRLAIERTRKELKEQALREGKAIDGISNVLKALIVPIEEYLGKQEKFIEIRAEEKREQLRLEAEKKIEEERIAQEKAEAEEKARIKAENEKLKREAEERERKMEEEGKKQEAALAEQKAKAEAERKALEEKAEAEKKAIEEKARKEREEQAKKIAEQEAKAEAERKKVAEEARKKQEAAQAKAEIERRKKERLAEILKNQVECPKCHHKFQLKGERS